ncbi:hypothetical protein Golax_025431 [Gossypium laxum]|uniref:Uncharacterized protein n=1 Tax=Gossypium laxum TaxID=34288 RepID=A0A7J9B5E2_9ROSI|nr:hypothetical protein [Gossypium laxum]
MLPKDGVYTTQLDYSERRINSVETNQFNCHIGSSLPEDEVYIAQLVYSERRVNLVKANNLNGHIGSSLQEDGVYIAKSVYLECIVNSLQEKTLNGHVGSSLQYELLTLGLDFCMKDPHKSTDKHRLGTHIKSQANEFQSIGNSESQHYNFIQPRSSTLLRIQVPAAVQKIIQLLNQVPNRPNASNSLLQHSMLTKHSVPS